MAFFATVTVVLVASANALIIREAASADPAPTTFPAYYAAAAGRGIWKWDNALVAYQRHFGMLAGKPVSVAEVGVQSGGSLLMWKAVLGQQIMMHGLDINPQCEAFKGPNVTITIGDQGDMNMWNGFYTKVPAGLDILIDDGGHMPAQMMTTLKAAFPHTHEGGYVAIEDITVCPHCPPYLEEFFKPTAAYVALQAQSGLIYSVHLYPMLLIVRRNFAPGSPRAAEGILEFAAQKTVVADLTAMWTAISSAPPGSQIELRNPAWTNLFLVDSLTNFFSNFIDLSLGTFKDTPAGCATTAAAVCTNEISPLCHLQARVSGVHIYKDHAVIEVPASPPRIAAVRKGTEWIGYGL